MFSIIKKLLFISRPISWPNTAYPFAAGYIISGGSFDVVFVLGTLYFLIPYNLLMYGINDIFDYESDLRNPRKGGIEGAKEQKVLHPAIWWGVAITNVPLVAWLLWQGTLEANLTLAAVLFLVVAYSLKYLRFKEVPVLDSLTSSSHFVGPLVFALVMTGSLEAGAPYAIAFFLWGMASHAFGAIQDIVPDTQGGLVSVATVFGAKLTARLAVLLYLVSAGLVMAQGWPAVIVGLCGLVYAANVWPYVSLTNQQSGQANHGWRRFMVLNYLTGFVITVILILHSLG